jgi:hypothetical protein
MHWFGYDIEIVGKVGRTIFVVNVQANNLACVETNAPKFSVPSLGKPIP